MTAHTIASFNTHSLTIELPLDVADALAQTHEDGLEGAAVAALQLWLKIGTKHLNLANAYAAEHDIHPHVAIRKAIGAYMDTTIPSPAASTPMRNLRASRDAEVYRRAKLGVKRQVLAKDYGLSEIRIHQIVAAGKKADPINDPKAKAQSAELRRVWEGDDL